MADGGGRAREREGRERHFTCRAKRSRQRWVAWRDARWLALTRQLSDVSIHSNGGDATSCVVRACKWVRDLPVLRTSSGERRVKTVLKWAQFTSEAQNQCSVSQFEVGPLIFQNGIFL